jgi:hypothetical protein
LTRLSLSPIPIPPSLSGSPKNNKRSDNSGNGNKKAVAIDGPAIGISLGTTYSVSLQTFFDGIPAAKKAQRVAVQKSDGRVELIASHHGRLPMAEILRGLKAAAEAHLLGETTTVSDVVIAVPADGFGDGSRRAVREAARLAGLHVLALTCKPLLAAIAHGLDREPGKKISNKVIFIAIA